MKIEKINDNQIKCYLTAQDLEEHKIKFSELVYGSEKAKKLFRDMLLIASEQCGFNSEDCPIMVEAIPAAPDSLILIITKVDNPDELDARFSKFTPYNGAESEDEAVEKTEDVFGGKGIEQISLPESESASGKLDKVFDSKLLEDILDNLSEKYGKEAREKVKALKNKEAKNSKEASVNKEQIYKTFIFDSLEQVASFAHASHSDFGGVSQLYKNSEEGRYYLVLGLKNADTAQYNKACNIACEFGETAPEAKMSYYTEHFKCIIKKDALGVLSVFM